jgi:hypothetical protein
MAANNTYITCSTVDPDILDAYTDGELEGSFLSDGVNYAFNNTYIWFDNLKLKIYVDETKIVEADET